MAQVWLNGALLNEDQARISPADRGFLLGDGAFETMRVEAGRMRRWQRHRARLSGALGALAIPTPDWGTVEAGCDALLAASALDDAVVRLTVSRGPHGPGLFPPVDADSTVLITARPRSTPPRTMRLQIVDAPRRDRRNLSCRYKLSGYADMLMARREAVRARADMAVVMSNDGALASADSANLFWMRRGQIMTPGLQTGCLPGVARSALIEAVRGMGLSVEEGCFEPSYLFEAEAVWVTNAVLGAVAVVALNDQSLPDPRTDCAWVFALAAAAD